MNDDINRSDSENTGAASVVDGGALRLTRLNSERLADNAAARAFCLTVIRDVYGFAYRPDWHADLDSLCAAANANHYGAPNHGAFWLVSDSTGAPVATIGIRRLAWQTGLIASLAPRYSRMDDVATLGRAYVRQDMRRRGIGAWLATVAEREAQRFGYSMIYLHTNADADAARRFWVKQGWREFDRFGISAHFDKRIGDADK